MKKGSIQIVENFLMPELNRKRTLRIYLPPEYDNSEKKYPVLYMHDAQNLFDVNTSSFGSIWDAAKAADERYHNDNKEGIIIVGIDNEGDFRYLEYSPWYNSEIIKLMPHADTTSGLGGEGFQYIEFIVNTLKPFIDSKYKTLSDRDNTGIAGSSMGGFISLVAGIKYQEVFSKIAAFSTAMFFCEEEMRNLILEVGKKCDMKIYMDIGTKETSNHLIEEFPTIYLQSNINISKVLLEAGFTQEEVTFVIANEAIHNEQEWAKRLPTAIKWLFCNL